ncbi:hypothetical protein L9G16_04105 [Shewanella sp. A25]|nr:hypothetical protein [Shewanella shenzhenensis]
MTAHLPFPALARNESLLTIEQRIDAAYRKGLEEGLERGKQQGHEAALQALHSEMDDHCRKECQRQTELLQSEHQERLDLLVMALQNRLKLEEDTVADALFTLLQHTAQLVLEAELSQQPQVYITAIKTGLALLHGREHIDKILVSPADGQWLTDQKINQINGIEIGIDMSLKAGEALFDCGSQVQQLSFEARLEEVLQQIKQVLVNAD